MTLPRKDTAETPAPMSRRSVWLTYGAAFTTDSQGDLISFIIPLWGIALGLSPLEIGILVSAKGVLPSILAIHGGVLMDRYGTRLMLVLMGAASALIPPMFIASTWFPALVLLQMALGLCTSYCWMGAQSLAVIVSRGDTGILGRFSFSARVGVLIAPVAAGVLWDYTPPWVSFMAMAVMGAAFWFTVRGLPAAEIDGPQAVSGHKDGEGRPPFRLRDILPSLSDYIGAIGLLVIPAVAFVVIVSSVRLSNGLIMQSFYIVYLKELGLQATIIGAYISLTQGMAAVGTLVSSWFTRRIDAAWVFLGMVMVSVFASYSTPLYGDHMILLALVIAVRGIAQGASQPVMYSILSRAVGREAQATAIGLRATGNRLATLTVPVLMGAIAEFWGLNATFYVTGALLMAVAVATALWYGLSEARRARTGR